jgi:hypothetical protein
MFLLWLNEIYEIFTLIKKRAPGPAKTRASAGKRIKVSFLPPGRTGRKIRHNQFSFVERNVN